MPSASSATVWLCLFGLGYAARSFKSHLRKNPPIPRRDVEGYRELLRLQLQEHPTFSGCLVVDRECRPLATIGTACVREEVTV